MKKMYLFMFAFLVASLSLTSCGGSSSKSPGDVVKKSYDLLESGNYAKIADLYASADGKMLTDEEKKKMEGMIGMAAQEQEKNGKIIAVTINEENLSDDGTSCKVKYTIEYDSGKTDNEKADLKLIEGKWYLVLKL
jgi:hypothetical protein